MLHVFSDALRTADNRELTLLAMLDLSAVFDCVQPFNFATTIAAELWSNRRCLTMADIVSEWPDTADDLRWSVVCNSADVVWRSAGGLF